MLHMMSSPPKVSVAVDTSALTSVRTVTSVRRNTARPPAASMSATVAAPLVALMSPTTTAAPARARVWATARPMPLPPPVTTATRPSSRNIDSSATLSSLRLQVPGVPPAAGPLADDVEAEHGEEHEDARHDRHVRMAAQLLQPAFGDHVAPGGGGLLQPQSE